jgi:ankyrin repeat protein
MKQALLGILAALACASCRPALHKAVQDRDVDRVRELLNDGADVNVRNANKGRLQYTPLHWAAHYGHLEIAEILISRGADLDAEDPDYSTPLYLAAEQVHPKVVEFLISKGAEVNVKSSRSGYTPLHRAAWGPVTMRKHLGGRTVSEAELNENYLKIVGMLLEKGAKVNARDNDGKTPLDQAIKNGEKEIVVLLRKHGGKTSEELKAVETEY